MKTSGGFSLIEILIVVVLLSIAAMMAVPMFSNGASVQLRSAANIVAADLEYAKNLAISKSTPITVVFDEVQEAYQLQDKDGQILSHPVKKGFDYKINFSTDSRLSQVEIYDADFDGEPSVTFDSLGSPYSGINTSSGGLNSGTVILKAANQLMTVSVEPVTGYITISD